ncbi:MAG: MBL fold metallo-hydrolase [Ruminococcaceae bacterium]|nr:MBL fold metallo-hydrolase [Oscillospiraceae bacterium]
MKAELIDEGLYRILVPFEAGITTTVYVVICAEAVVIIDSASYPTDASNYILPALLELGIMPSRDAILILTHSHSDHAGGAAALLNEMPNLKPRAAFRVEHPEFSYLADGEIVGDRLLTLMLPGHTENSIALFDMKTKTLLSADCLQLKGIGKYRNGIAFPTLYRKSIERLKRIDVHRIVAAHEYDPLGSIAEGKAEVLKYLDECLKDY